MLFRSAENMTQAMDVYAGMIGLHGIAIPFDVALQISSESLMLLVLAVVVAASEPQLNVLARQMYFNPPQPQMGGTATLTAATSLLPTFLIAAIGVISIMKLAEASFSPFLYFQF